MAWPSLPCRAHPLRPATVVLPPVPHPDRTTVELHQYTHPDGRSFLLDQATGLLYVPPPAELVNAAAGAARQAGQREAQMAALMGRAGAAR